MAEDTPLPEPCYPRGDRRAGQEPVRARSRPVRGAPAPCKERVAPAEGVGACLPIRFVGGTREGIVAKAFGEGSKRTTSHSVGQLGGKATD